MNFPMILDWNKFQVLKTRFLIKSLQFLLTPPDEGPRVKGQRIKLQDIIEGMYNPLTSNNGCWISCK